MNYVSTRGSREAVTSAMAIQRGIAPDGGLFVPENIPQVDAGFIASLVPLDYRQRAQRILGRFLTDYSEKELQECLAAAYSADKFDCPEIAPLNTVGDLNILELWHGPTSAFKDMALQVLPRVLSLALTKNQEKSDIVILVATSGDTGKAALEGFKDVPRIRIIVFYPHNGVSNIQRLQMVSQEGGNVDVVAVRGNFDDTQTGVKILFQDEKFQDKLAASGLQFSSANSINWGRLAPQIIYYFSAYADLLANNRIVAGQPVNFVVPTGNFGNILAGYYAKLMGLPVARLICASNSNNVLTDFLQNGVYDRKREFFKTLSPSMDILVSSNLERLLYHITNGNTVQVADWMDKLKTDGCYSVAPQELAKIKDTFWAGWADDALTVEAIRKVYTEYGYVMDPHTAVAWQVYEQYRSQSQDQTPCVIVSTASPFKFNESVLQAIGGSKPAVEDGEFASLEALAKLTGWQVPAGLAELTGKPVKHTLVCAKEEMPVIVEDLLGMQGK
ncbi:MAG: threonine synthase [Firmicutes bacterium]|nr:threonine synthase [Bacillota bacterium]